MFVANMPRAITGPEEAVLDRGNQFSTYGLVIHPPTVVYTALVNGTPVSYDHLVSLTYDTGSGVLGDVLSGMTLWVGTTAGAYDVGMVRIRKAPDGTHFYIGEVSDLKVLDNQFLTVIDEMGIWARHPFLIDLNAGTIDEDYDIAYTNQHTNRNPIPVMGPSAVLEFYGNPVSVGFDARDSWVPGGGAATYSWAAPGASATSGLATAQPTLTYNAEGTYRVACTVTIGGVSTTGYRYVYVVAPSHMLTQFSFSTVGGSQQSGGWAFDVTMYAGADLATIRDRAFVVLCSQDFAGNSRVRQGYVAGRENIVMCGWIYGESIDWSPDYGQVTFTVQGPRQWIGRTQAFLLGLYNTTGTPDRWILYNGLCFQAAIWHVLFWRSTLATMLDCLVEPNVWNAQEFSVPAQDLWQQLVGFSDPAIKAGPLCDRYGRLFVIKDSQFQTSRGGYPEVMTLDGADWTPPLTIKRSPYHNVSMVYYNGAALSGATPTAYFALSPGHAYTREGAEQHIEGQIVPDQATGLHMAGLLLGWYNNEYASLQATLAHHNRWLDIAPPMYVDIAVLPTDTVRGIALAIRAIPRSISYAWDAQTGVVTTKVELEAETFEQNSQIGDPPQVNNTPPPPPTVCAVGFHFDTATQSCVADPVLPPGPRPDPDLVYVWNANDIGRCRNFTAAPGAQNWVKLTGAVPSGAIQGSILNPWDSKNSALTLTTTALYRCDDLDTATPPTWVLKLTASDVQTATGLSGVRLDYVTGAVTENGCFYVGWAATDNNTTLGVSHSTDGGATWSHVAIVGQTAGRIKRIVASNTAVGKVYAALEGASFTYDASIYVSSNHGATWSVMQDWGFTSHISDMDVAYADADQTIIALTNSVNAQYSHNNGASFALGMALTQYGAGQDGNTYILINIATANQLDVLLVAQTTQTEFWHSTDGGVTYTSVFHPSIVVYGNGRSTFALGRWPYDSNKVFWLVVPGVTDAGIWYSTDLLTTQENHTGDWASAIGAWAAPVNIIPVWVS